MRFSIFKTPPHHKLAVSSRIRAAFLFWLPLALIQPAVAQQPAKSHAVEKDIWAVSRISGSDIGSYHEVMTMGQDHQIVTSIENDLVFNRLGSKVEMKSSSRYEEGADGHLLSVSSEMSSSAQSTKTEAAVRGNSLVIRTSTGGKSYGRTLPFTGELLGPVAARQLALSRLKSPGDVISFQMFYPELGSVVTITEKLAGRESLSFNGQTTPALKIEQTMSAMPGTVLLWLDSDGWLLRQLTPSPFGDIETLRAPAGEAEGSDVKGAPLPAESFTQTLVPSNIWLPEERLIERLTIRITQKKPQLGWPNFTADNQKVIEMTGNQVVLEIRQILPKADGQRPVTNPDLQPFLEPNALLQSDDPTVRAIAAKIAGGNTNAYETARALQKWTNENMKFDPGIAIAPASEVARDRRGTCFGYAVILASLARAEGIPSRIRMGFVYAGGVWGGHAWVEIMAGGTWIPLDAALYSPGPADAARFSFFTSSLQEGTIAQVGELAKLYGNVDIQILDYTIHGKKVVVPSDAKPFVISGNTYRNPWLGLTVQKPQSFHFTTLDAVWPASTVVAMEGPQGQIVEIQSHSDSLPVQKQSSEEKLLRDAGITGAQTESVLGGNRATLVSSPNAAGLAVRQGGYVLVITAKGTNAAHLLLEVASTLKLGR
jgi:hypothetical protein